jgi:hypothetical protein
VAPPTKLPPGSNIVKLLALIAWFSAFTGDKNSIKKRIVENFTSIVIIVFIDLYIIAHL